MEELVSSKVKESENSILTKLDALMTSKLSALEQKISVNQRELSDAQLSKIQQNFLSNDYTFKRRGNEEQFKVNAKVMGRMEAADAHLDDVVVAAGTSAATASTAATAAKESIKEGIDILNHRQKLIKLADSSELGWKVVEEYEQSPLACDSDDQKKIDRAQFRADRKYRRQKSFRGGKRQVPYVVPVPAEVTQGPRKPGVCFRCGKPGHWRNECKAVLPDVQADISSKISVLDCSCSLSSVSVFEVCEVNCKTKEVHVPLVKGDRCQGESGKNYLFSPVGRLKACMNHWKNAGASEYVLQVIDQGYRLPLKNIPEKVVLRNNKSARENPNFVSREIESLLTKRCISEVRDVPYVVNPLTVAFNRSGKARLVLDLRHVNLELFKFKCCYEDQSVARHLFKKGDYLFCFDLKSAYHFISIYEPHRTYLGFSWVLDGQTKYFRFNVLPFGASVAGFIFTKVLRTVLQKWRSLGHRVQLFLDDGIGGSDTFEKAQKVSNFVRQDLLDFGFVLAEEKCVWFPRLIMEWLGHLWNMEVGTVHITEQRIQRAENALVEIIEHVTGGRTLVVARKLAALVGQILSMQSAVGPLVRLRTRYMYECIMTRASWNAPVMLSAKSFEEIFWKENLRKLNGSSLDACVGHADLLAYSDASGVGYGGYVEGLENPEVIGGWTVSESEMSSTWRELEAVHRVLNTAVHSLEGKCVEWNTDNKNVSTILKVGSKKAYLQDIAVKIDDSCREKGVELLPVWVPREKNCYADLLSKCTDSDDWAVQYWFFSNLRKEVGKIHF